MRAVDQFIAAALVWISAQMSYGAPPPAPPVAMVQPAVLEQMAAATVPGADAFIESGAGGPAGLFDAASGTIYLPDDFDLAQLEDRATLVHELVHYVQVQAGMSGLPDSALESQAYDLEYRWRDTGAADMPAGTVRVRVESRGAGATGSREVKTFPQS